jgi:hypothetical protein
MVFLTRVLMENSGDTNRAESSETRQLVQPRNYSFATTRDEVWVFIT